jgi:hypothetical protein
VRAVTGERIASPSSGGPGLRAQIAAAAVVLALAALAAYTVFSGPTTVPIKAPAAAPAQSAPPVGGQEPESERGGRGD